MCIVYTYTDG